MIKKNSSHSSKSRTLKPKEKDFLIAIIGENDPKSIGLESLDSILVQELLDGHMGSIRFLHDPYERRNRQLGQKWKEIQFYDEDGILVLASILLDNKGLAYELEIWKTDFNPLIRFPKKEDISIVPS
ncbi:DUF6984 family protein [Leptospira interrogans]|uniref:DUF6984 family protein n=1 Tax=Leptospira interrogans TaxID=173 RepID=UPI0002928035|nr:hypothetical protein [Leptospira interrogans]ASV07217.1 hypothetical protein B2G47_16840 [Leptospira interrogans serovar Canicola]EKO69477.1 hypothetical protein LEP1GSC069_2318 [Leptospira interrogans serovar Canicola str. Fiocruz LV133]EMK18057.1 hypothetical protein LEP1GSC075_1643 [Leptospira interrogans str. Kito]EMN75651.1 hypothetical protein LEP1GSC102_0979 [Leptospira interrogans str. UI 09600]MCH5432962.1 hypothetical protein [Leptospira interrogans serovar Canicola]